MLKLSVALIALYTISSVSSLPNEVVKPATSTKEALIIPKHFLRKLKFPFPFPPLLGKPIRPFGIKPISPPSEPLGPLGILSEKSDYPQDSKFIGSVDSLPFIPQQFLNDGPKSISFLNPFSNIFPRRKNVHPLGPNPNFPSGFNNVGLVPIIPNHNGLRPEIPEILNPKLDSSIISPSNPEVLFRDSFNSTPRKPLFVPEPTLERRLLDEQEKAENKDDSVAKSIAVNEPNEEVEIL